VQPESEVQPLATHTPLWHCAPGQSEFDTHCTHWCSEVLHRGRPDTAAQLASLWHVPAAAHTPDWHRPLVQWVSCVHCTHEKYSTLQCGTLLDRAQSASERHRPGSMRHA